jgi:hypothetical protein
MAVLFDTLKLADRLEAAGMPPRQAHDTAEALAKALTDTVATSADIAAVHTDLETSVAAVRGEIRESELRLRNEIATVRTAISELRRAMRTGDERLRKPGAPHPPPMAPELLPCHIERLRPSGGTIVAQGCRSRA